MDADTVLSLIFGAILAAFSLTLVGYSFVRHRPAAPHANNESAPPNHVTPSLAAPGDSGPAEASLGNADGIPDLALDAIYDSINTLELEFQLGKIPVEQFEEQFRSYRFQAAATLKQQLETGQRGPLWGLEQEVLIARSALRSSETALAPCPDCSAPVAKDSRNCPECGAEIVGNMRGPSSEGSKVDQGG